MPNNEKKENKKQKQPYTVEDALKIADDIMDLGKEKKYNMGAFIHGMVFALEYAQFVYNIPPKQIAEIKRSCRKYFQEMEKMKQNEKNR